jgi:hypothetical protein
MEPYSRIEVIYLQNDTIGDGVFIHEVAKTLREYADMLEKNQAGREHVEIYENPRGTKLTAIGVTWYGERIPQRSPIEDPHRVGRTTR